MESSKKKGSNFTKSEVDVLVNEVEANRDTFGKLSMQLTAAMKKKCWEGIAEKVNGVGASEVRTEKSVRKKWTDVTSRTKKVEAARRRELSATGGGECSYAAVNGVEAKIVEMMGSEVIDGIVPGIMHFGLMQPEECFAGDSRGMLSFREPMESQTVYMAVAADVPVTVATQIDKNKQEKRSTTMLTMWLN